MRQIQGSFKKPITDHVTFKQDGTRMLGVTDIDGFTAEVSLNRGRHQAKDGQTWLVRIEGAFTGFPDEKKMLVRGTLLEEVDLVDETDIDLMFVRGVNTSTNLEQWECRVHNEIAGITTLYVADRKSLFMPKMNGERYACMFVREVWPNEKFCISFVDLVEKLDAPKLIPHEVALQKAAQDTGIIGSIGSNRVYRDPVREARRAALHAAQPAKGSNQEKGLKQGHGKKKSA